MRRLMWWVSVMSLFAILASGCGSSSSKKAGSTKKTTTTAETTTETTAAETTAAPTTTASGTAAKATMAVDPSTGLTNGQTVKVTGTGFKAGLTLGVTECADKGDATTSDDCDLGAIKTGKSDATGAVAAIDYAANKGPFGKNAIVCSATVKCLLSLGELSADPNAQRADNTVELAFAG